MYEELSDKLIKSRFGEKMTRDGLLNRVRRIGSLAGLDISPHVLRRAFVTINANKGRSLVMLQMACGHSDIKTTRSYCKTSEDEMISAMKDWE
jgi:site-specific recombinase XerD